MERAQLCQVSGGSEAGEVQPVMLRLRTLDAAIAMCGKTDQERRNGKRVK